MIKSKSARFLQELADGPPEERGTRVVAVRSSAERKRFVAGCLEQLETVTSQPAVAHEWDAASEAMAHIEQLARVQLQPNVAEAAHAVRIYCGLAREHCGRYVTTQYDALHTQLAGLLLRVYILGTDAEGVSDVAALRATICGVFPQARLHLIRPHAQIMA